MLLSAFTPVNNTRWLHEAHASLDLQSGADWEWILVHNGISSSDIPESIRNDPRVRIYPYPESLPRHIGALKRFACDQSHGDVLVELDQDDMLAPRSLAAIAREIDKGAGFVYSDAAVFMDGSYRPVSFNAAYGWENYPIRIYNWPLRCTKSFPLTARSLCEVHFAPDHVRCWSRDAYYAVDGHDPSMLVADDHDLVCRTYLSGAKFGYTDSCGYLYRWHDQNSHKNMQPEIRALQAENRSKYLRPLVEKWQEGLDEDFADMGEWVTAGWLPEHRRGPVADNALAYIRADNTLQLFSVSQVSAFMNMAHKALVPGGWLLIDVPDARDPKNNATANRRTDYRPESFACYTNEEHAKLTNGEVKCRFQMVHVENYWRRFGGKERLYIRFDLCALKGQRQPGKQLI